MGKTCKKPHAGRTPTTLEACKENLTQLTDWHLTKTFGSNIPWQVCLCEFSRCCDAFQMISLVMAQRFRGRIMKGSNAFGNLEVLRLRLPRTVRSLDQSPWEEPLRNQRSASL